MDKRLLIPVLIGIAVVAVAVVFILSGTKGAHLELQWKLVKPRVGALDENSSAVVADFRIENPSDVRFMVGDVTATLTTAKGETLDGQIVARSDVPQLLQFNRLLGNQYNPVLTVRDEIKPHVMFDRMVAVRFETPLAELQKAQKMTLSLHEVDGLVSSTDVALK
ncbi:MAG TPA: hypothetical protein VMJ34_11100 [Bryobacteraceae bacterium]|nr:hypothetical protein [Bryobacteraceae bacterium]